MDKDSAGSDNFRGYKCEFLYSKYDPTKVLTDFYLSSYLVTLDTRHPQVDGISGRRRPPHPVPGVWPRPLLMFLIPVPLSGGSGPSQVFGHVKLKPFYYLFLWMLGSTTEMSSVDDGSDSANAIDDDNTTSAITKDGEEWNKVVIGSCSCLISRCLTDIWVEWVINKIRQKFYNTFR